MVKDDRKAGSSKKTRETQNPHGKIGKEDADGPNLGGSGDSQSGKGMENGSRVSVNGKEGESAGVDGGDDIGMTLIELSSKRGRKRGTQQVKAGREASKIGDGGGTDEKTASMSGGDSAILRRSSRKRIVVDPGDYSKNLKKGEDGEKRKEEEDPGEEEEDEEEKDEESFSVGDFVWGKVKSHPWWPGRVFDPSEASQQALKYKHEGKILVAYFGDATFAWCDPSQLKPFVENFAEMSKQSSSKGFVSAVEDAVAEFGRLVELDMTCYCTSRKDESAHQQSTVNAGIKGGVNVNKGGIGIYSVDRFEPAGFLADLRFIAKHVSVGNMLELTTLKSRVSAIYRSKDGHLLLKVNEPQEAADDEGDGAGAEDSFRGPVEEPVQIMPGMLDGSKRKERSVADILYGNEDGGSAEGEQANKNDSKSGRKKRKVEDESQKKTSDQGQRLGNDSLVTQSGKRNKELTEAPKGKIDHGENTEEEKKMGRRSSRMKMKESPKVIVVENNLAAIEESEMSPRTRERKKSRYLSPPYTDLGYYRQTAVSSPRTTEAKAVESASQLTGSPPLVKCSGETFEKNLTKEGDGEHGKSNASAAQTPRRGSRRKVIDDPTKSIASSNNVLSEIRSAALSGQFREEQSFDTVKGFLSSYRSSKYHNGSNYNSCEGIEGDDKSGEKGESAKVRHGLDQEAANHESKRVKKSRTKHEKAKSEDKVNEVDSKTDGKMIGATQSAALLLKFPPDYPLPSEDDLGAIYSKYGELDLSKTQISQKSSSVRLVFLRASDAEAACKSSKASNPFGATKVSYRIRHLGAISGDKEAEENGFSKKDSSYSGLKRKARSSQKRSMTSTSDGGLRLVKQKLEGMATMVAEAGDGKMSEEIKLNLETRLKDLLEEVKALPALPSSSRSGV